VEVAHAVQAPSSGAPLAQDTTRLLTYPILGYPVMAARRPHVAADTLYVCSGLRAVLTDEGDGNSESNCILWSPAYDFFNDTAPD
jgi:hypothetical protein